LTEARERVGIELWSRSDRFYPSHHAECAMADRLLIWKLHTLDHRIASVRYRALLPMLTLGRKNITSRFYRTLDSSLGIRQLRGAHALILVKSCTVKDLILAQRAHELGVPIILDLCDNIFVPNYTDKYPIPPCEVFDVMARYADVITTTGPALAEVIGQRIRKEIPIVIVPDGIETERSAREGRKLLRRARIADLVLKATSPWYLFHIAPRAVRAKLYRTIQGGRHWTCDLMGNLTSLVRRRYATTDESSDGRVQSVDRMPALKTLIWFGNAGGEYGRFGLSDIVDIAAPLSRAFQKVPFQLVVVSNSREAYQRTIAPLPFPSRYVEWNPQTIYGLIRASDVVLIPNSMDDFARCKSANRALMALSLNVPVVATLTPAMEAFRGCTFLNNWEDGIVQYLTDSKLVSDHLQKAEAVMKNFSDDAIAERWETASDLAEKKRLARDAQDSQEERCNLVVVLHLVQDLDLVSPILRAAKTRSDLNVQVWVTQALLENSFRVWRSLKAIGIPFRVILDNSSVELEGLRFAGIDALLTAAETNQRAHRLAHKLAMRAEEAGVATYTMQHGLENIGLTYSDSVHPITGVLFASKTIFTWGPPRLLHIDIPETTRRKCLSVGWSKEVHPAKITIDVLERGSYVVGVFENLHWHRYDRMYIEQFLADWEAVIQQHPGIKFLIKPHHAGQWLTSRHKGPIRQFPNLIIADPADRKWEPYTAADLLGAVDCVITTPSTVALDAAFLELPVAVVAYNLDLAYYNNLPLVRNRGEWTSFIQQSQEPSSRQFLMSRSREFARNMLCSGNAVSTILETIKTDVRNRMAGRMRSDRPARVGEKW
jgi:glycosyltransferase involved in cell wall biosynthesis